MSRMRARPTQTRNSREFAFDVRGGQTVDHHVEHRRKPRCLSAPGGCRHLARIRYELAEAAERARDLVVARRQELATGEALTAVVAKLDLILGVPAGIVPDC